MGEGGVLEVSFILGNSYNQPHHRPLRNALLVAEGNVCHSLFLIGLL